MQSSQKNGVPKKKEAERLDVEKLLNSNSFVIFVDELQERSLLRLKCTNWSCGADQ